ncbi:hypothetical protein AYI68_g7024 [Smittium mucronatum]|uniref:Uncharacterized protein n=1 Tax=Smittium mucronatum TaxID=133383 RepID=A0A1R0GPU5_9FUNG|nr:hypothetical protein AYI68_g7024 [Smittium mucronatum]
MAIHTTSNRNNGMYPAEMMYGVRLETPASWLSVIMNSEDLENRIRKNIPQLIEQVTGNIILLYTGQAKNKMDPLTTGPYTITKILDHGRYEIEDHKGNLDIVHADRIKLYTNPIEGIPTVGKGHRITFPSLLKPFN